MAARSDAMHAVFRKIRRVATHLAPVLIIGETGTGKELVARAIHAAGPRRDGPFVAVNCAALPRELIESELFGYRRGAFSGAATEYLGLFRAAAGGTLLLDEVTEMAPELQAKLLRVLQDRTVRPVGAVNEVPVDVRIIASTNRDPDTAMASRLLRPDLYYRLSSSRIVVPPLRARPEDIPVLVTHCLGLLGARHPEYRERPRRITPDGLALLQAQPWPGNVRELFNVIEETVTMVGVDQVGPEELRWASTVPVFSAAGGTEVEIPTLAAAERRLIERALASNDGNKLRAARQLGISRTKLYAKIAKYELCEVGDAAARGAPPAGRGRPRSS
jgi:transcriptional regulator with PAS, ATPase and Fis domain